MISVTPPAHDGSIAREGKVMSKNYKSGWSTPFFPDSCGGGAACEFCSSLQIPPFSPGQSLSASVNFIGSLELVSAFTLRGTTYDPNAVSFGSSLINSGIFTFPAGRKSPFVFTVVLPALFSDIHGIVLSSGETLTLAINPGKLVLNFYFAPGTPGSPSSYSYTGGEFVTVPEPSAFLMLGTGLLGVLGAMRKMLHRGM